MSNPLLPNTAQIGQHLRHLVDELPVNCQDGEIEIAYTDTNESGPKYARHFRVKDIDRAIAFAAKKNAQEGCNVYVGAALRKPGRGSKRSKAEDVLAFTALCVDLDDKAAVESAEQNCRHCPPTAIVTTGRVPHRRQQFWWKFNPPLYDLGAATWHLQAIGKAIGGDPAVKDAARLMRLGGSIAWPKKPGRVAELTEFTLCGEAYDV